MPEVIEGPATRPETTRPGRVVCIGCHGDDLLRVAEVVEGDVLRSRFRCLACGGEQVHTDGVALQPIGKSDHRPRPTNWRRLRTCQSIIELLGGNWHMRQRYVHFARPGDPSDWLCGIRTAAKQPGPFPGMRAVWAEQRSDPTAAAPPGERPPA